MANTCYGQPGSEPPASAAFVVDEASDKATPDPAAAGGGPSPATTQPSAPAGADADTVGPVEPAAKVLTVTSSGSVCPPKRETDEPRLALEQMSPVIEGGMLMVFGPEGDPVPPLTFAAAAAAQPDLLLGLPDGRTVRAARIASVLAAQTLGPLGVAEGGDAWILAMLLGDAVESASADELQTEQDHCDLTVVDGRVVIARAGEAFQIADAAPDLASSDALRLVLGDDTPLSVDSLIALLHRATGAAVSGGGDGAKTPQLAGARAETGSAGEQGGAAHSLQSDRLVVSGCRLEIRPDGLWLAMPSAAVPGNGFGLSEPTDGARGPLVGVVSKRGATLRLADLIGLANRCRNASVASEGRVGPEGRARSANEGGASGRDSAIGEDCSAATDDLGSPWPDADRGRDSEDDPGADPYAEAVEGDACRGIGLDQPFRGSSDSLVETSREAGPLVERELDGLDAVSGAERGIDLEGLDAVGDAECALDLDGLDAVSGAERGLELEGLDAVIDAALDLDFTTAWTEHGPADCPATADSGRFDRLPATGDERAQCDAPKPAPASGQTSNESEDAVPVAGPSDLVVRVGHDTEVTVGATAGHEPPTEALTGAGTTADRPLDVSPATTAVAGVGSRQSAPGREAQRQQATSEQDACGQDAIHREAFHAQSQGRRQDTGAQAAQQQQQIFARDAAERNAFEQGARIDQRIAQAPGPFPRAPAQVVSSEPDVDPESIALVVIRGVPEDAVLSTGTRDDDGSWSISPLDLSSVVISLACQDSPGEVEGELDITGIALSERGELVAISEKVPLTDYVLDPTTAAGVAEESAPGPAAAVAPEPAEKPGAAPGPAMIPLAIDPGAWDAEPFDALVIRDVPAGAQLSAGAYDPSIDGWVLMPQHLDALAIAPPPSVGGGFSVTLVGIALRSGDGDGARVLARLPVIVPRAADSDAATIAP